MTFVPSWTRDIYPRLCHECGTDCRRSDNPRHNLSRRELCPGCLEMFCYKCIGKHEPNPYAKPKKPCAAGKSAEDHDHLGSDELHIPGWKVAMIQKCVPGAEVTYHVTHTAGWSLKFFLNLEVQTIVRREEMELLCESLGCDWHMAPTAGLEPSHGVTFSKEHPDGKYAAVPPPEVPKGCENGVMFALNHVRR